MDTNEKQIALSVLENLRADLMCAHLKNESRELDVADLLQYIYSMTGSIKALECPTCTATTPATGQTSARAMVTMGKRIS